MKQLWRADEENKELARSLVREAVEKMQAEAFSARVVSARCSMMKIDI